MVLAFRRQTPVYLSFEIWSIYNKIHKIGILANLNDLIAYNSI